MSGMLDRVKKGPGGEAERLVEQLRELESLPALPGVGYGEEIARLQRRLEELRGEQMPTVAWKTVQAARAQGRPQTLEYLLHLAPDFIELHGDRVPGDDPAMGGWCGAWRVGHGPLWGTEGAVTEREAASELLGRHVPKGIGRPSVSPSSPSGSRCRLCVSSIRRVHFRVWRRNAEARREPLRTHSGFSRGLLRQRWPSS